MPVKYEPIKKSDSSHQFEERVENAVAGFADRYVFVSPEEASSMKISEEKLLGGECDMEDLLSDKTEALYPEAQADHQTILNAYFERQFISWAIDNHPELLDKGGLVFLDELSSDFDRYVDEFIANEKAGIRETERSLISGGMDEYEAEEAVSKMVEFIDKAREEFLNPRAEFLSHLESDFQKGFSVSTVSKEEISREYTPDMTQQQTRLYERFNEICTDIRRQQEEAAAVRPRRRNTPRPDRTAAKEDKREVEAVSAQPVSKQNKAVPANRPPQKTMADINAIAKSTAQKAYSADRRMTVQDAKMIGYKAAVVTDVRDWLLYGNSLVMRSGPNSNTHTDSEKVAAFLNKLSKNTEGVGLQVLPDEKRKDYAAKIPEAYDKIKDMERQREEEYQK